MKETFSAIAYETTLTYEGGYVNHPADPGGATNFGITQYTFNSYLRRKGFNKPVSVRDITKAQVAEIYRTQYWDAVKGDLLPAGVDMVVYDSAVNSGPKNGIKWLQKALVKLGLYSGKIDGIIGNGTLSACQEVPDNDLLVTHICDIRLAFCKALKTWKTFGKGWQRRIDNLRKKGWAWATGSKGPAPEWSKEGQAKANSSDAKVAPAKGFADAVTGVGGISLPGGITLDQATDKITPYQEAIPWLQYVAFGLIAAGVILPVAGLAWRRYANKKKAELDEALIPDVVTA